MEEGEQNFSCNVKQGGFRNVRNTKHDHAAKGPSADVQRAGRWAACDHCLRSWPCTGQRTTLSPPPFLHSRLPWILLLCSELLSVSLSR